jgi:hypothetical protein
MPDDTLLSLDPGFVFTTNYDRPFEAHRVAAMPPTALIRPA